VGRPKAKDYTLYEAMQKISEAGIAQKDRHVDKRMQELPRRIQSLISIIDTNKLNFNEMIYLVMYDIENNKVRTTLAKYLLKKGCVRIQKSVYIARTDRKIYLEMCQALKEIQSYYENDDSIIILPATNNALQSISVIGKNIDIEHVIEPPNTLFI
jgi:CRISPR-associated endonuclease Cas2